MSEPVIAFLALGSNLGERRATIEGAVAALDECRNVRVRRLSTIIETEPIGPPGQGHFLNAVVEVETTLGPRLLLETCLEIEGAYGRVRPDAERWGPRTLDIDLLVYGDRTVNEPGLVVPHPRLAERRFVLEPLAELAPDLRPPGAGESVRDLLAEVSKAERQ